LDGIQNFSRTDWGSLSDPQHFKLERLPSFQNPKAHLRCLIRLTDIPLAECAIVKEEEQDSAEDGEDSSENLEEEEEISSPQINLDCSGKKYYRQLTVLLSWSIFVRLRLQLVKNFGSGLSCDLFPVYLRQNSIFLWFHIPVMLVFF
jgi:hypothetical protein